MLEPADTPITLKRAAEIAGLSPGTLKEQARRGKLATMQYGRDRLTTRRLLHDYLVSRDQRRGKRAPLPDGYVPPDAPAPPSPS